MNESVKISLRKYEHLSHIEKMFTNYQQNALIVKDRHGQTESFVCKDRDDRLVRLAQMNDEIYQSLRKAEKKIETLRDKQIDLKYFRNKSKTFEAELYHANKEIDRIKGIRKFDKIFAIVGLVATAFGVAFLMNYAIGNI